MPVHMCLSLGLGSCVEVGVRGSLGSVLGSEGLGAGGER